MACGRLGLLAVVQVVHAFNALARIKFVFGHGFEEARLFGDQR
jgi:hypothetical protein